MTGAPPIIRNIAGLSARLGSPTDTVRLCTLAAPADGSSASVFLEIWEPNGSQTLHSHSDSAEVFIMLSGTAIAHSDDHVAELVAGDVIVIAPGSEHRIVNTSATECLYSITVLADDRGLADWVARGAEVELTVSDLAAAIPGLRKRRDRSADDRRLSEEPYSGTSS